MSKGISKMQLIKGDAEMVLYERIRELIVAARKTVARGVDLVQVYTNYEIGRHIVEHEQQGEKRASYGKEVLKRLAEKIDYGIRWWSINDQSQAHETILFALCQQDKPDKV